MKALIALFLAAFVAGCAHDQSSGGLGTGSESVSGAAVSPGDSSFAREACETGTVETEIGKLAAGNTRNKEVRRFAQKLAEDHAQAEKELARLFSRKGIPPVTELPRPLQDSVAQLAGLKGGQFDEAFKQQVITDHENAIALFEKQAAEGADPELKAFAQRRMPQLRDHLEVARRLPVSSDTEGPPDNDVNTILLNPATRTIMPR
jgi:putative membrane protein